MKEKVRKPGKIHIYLNVKECEYDGLTFTSLCDARYIDRRKDQMWELRFSQRGTCKINGINTQEQPNCTHCLRLKNLGSNNG